MRSRCPICGGNANHEEGSPHTFNCKLCGKFYLDNNVQDVLITENQYTDKQYDLIKLKSALFYYLRVIKNNHESVQTVYIYNTRNKNGIDLDSIYNIYPKTFSKRIDMVMELLSTKIKDIGDHFSLLDYSNINYNFVLAQNYEKKEQIDGMFNILKKMVFLDGEQQLFTFTPKGWEKIDSLQRYKKSKTAFIAMSFDWENKEFPIKECKDLIKKAVIKAGYEPCIISEHQHNKSIPQEIENEIKKASFVITDLTTQNKGAYYEAGVAKGLGKEVIFTCHENDFNNIHFDTKQINTIKWSDKNTFVDDLYKRIKFTIGEYSEIK
ncbi:hypothetical protein [Pectinatus frisingensis]|uniref:hypothetical protein n=1 Tax=Pectinatus frisingensis TaxID=865 RepID=UPI0018C5A173|nr:hypothetical protein [Pectinatus frisingensis]